MKNNYDYFEHEADMGIIGYGDTIEEAFVNGARSCFAIMTDLTQVVAKQTIAFEFDEDDNEFAFVTWLNRLLTESKRRQLIFSHFELQHHGNHWRGKAQGETWREQHERGTEVKGATLTMLQVKEINQCWQAKCVVDV